LPANFYGAGEAGSPSWGGITGTLSAQTDVSDAINAKTTLSAVKADTDVAGAITHSQSAHAPSNAQKNSDITKAEIEAKLTGQISSHSHAGGAAGDIALTCRASTSSQVITAGWSAYVPGGYEIGNGLTMEIGLNSVLELG
jgi:hypothetical protein